MPTATARTASTHATNVKLKKRKSIEGSSSSHSSSHKRSKTVTSSTAVASSNPASILVSASAQTDFPRGGGSILTPLEHRQALREARAEADALFKDTSAPKTAKAKLGSRDGGAAATEEERQRAGLAKQKYNREKRNAIKKKHSLPGSQAAASSASTSKPKDLLRIEHLNYKRLRPGARLLCTILAIHPLALVLSLPGQLLGHVPITAISPALTQRLQALADADDAESEDGSSASDDEDDSADSDEDDGNGAAGSKAPREARSKDAPELHDLFKVGQWVQATVDEVIPLGAIKAADKNGPHGRRTREGGEYEHESRRVRLSLDPALFNTGVAVEELGRGYMLSVAVKSVEDHGYILDAGLEGGVEGFAAFKDAPGGKKGPKLHVGQVLSAAVLSVADNRRAITFTLQPSEVRAAFLGSKSTPPSLSGLLPGLAVDALITAVAPSGLNVKLFGLFNATIERGHLPALASGQTYETFFKPGKKVRSRVFWDLGELHAEQLALGEAQEEDDAQSGQHRKVALSAAAHVRALEPPVVSVIRGGSASAPQLVLSDAYPIGTVVQVKIDRVDADWGLFCSLTSSSSSKVQNGDDSASVPGFVHIAAVSDSHIDSLSTSDSAPYRAGSIHQARVIAHAPTDRLLLLSLKPSVLALKFMRVSEVAVGDIVKGSIVSADEKKIIIDIGGAHHGIVFPVHFADIRINSKKVLAKFKPGLAVRARVWAVNPLKNRIVLTLKKTLLESDLPIVGALQDARVGVVTHGVVSRLPQAHQNRQGGGVLVDLYGGLRAYVPAGETLADGTRDGAQTSVPTVAELNSTFFEGKTVKIRLTAVDYQTGRLIASVRQASAAYLERLNLSHYEIGQAVSGTVAAVHDDIVVLQVAPTQARGLVPLSLLARMRDVGMETLRADLSEGDEIGGLQVWSKNDDKGVLHLNDARAAPPRDATATERANGKRAKAQSGDGVDKAAVDALVIRNKVYTATVMSHGVRGDHNAVQVTLQAEEDGTGKSTSVVARLHVTDAYDDFADAAGPSTTPCVQGVLRGEGSRAAVNLPAIGSSVRCAVLAVGSDPSGGGSNRPRVRISTRPSVLSTASERNVRDIMINDAADLRVGSKYRGFVRVISGGGLTVELGRSVRARIKVREAVDVLSQTWQDQFEVGKLVEGRILKISDTGSNPLIDMTLRTPREELAKQRKKGEANGAKDPVKSKKNEQKKLPFQHGLEQLEKGQKLKCVVKGIKEDLGLFLQVQLAGTNISGLCHKSEIADNGSPEAIKAYTIGDRVKAIVLKVNLEDKRISFGLKPSYFSDEDFVDSDEEDAALEGVDVDSNSDDEDEEEDEDEDDDDEVDEADSEDGTDDSAMAGVDEDDSDAETAAEEMDVDSDDGDVLDMPTAATAQRPDSVADKPTKSKTLAPLQVSGGFGWSGAQDDEGSEGESDDSSSDSEVDEPRSKQSTAAKRAQASKAKQGTQVDSNDKVPESASEFERLLLGSPNNSFLWIQFMSFQLQLSDVQAARQVAQRALKVINYREEQEKLNVWVALLNLEDQYGTEASLDAAFKEAVQANDAETVFMRMLAILEKSNKLAKAETIWNRAVKKFNTSLPVWSGLARFYLRHNRPEDVRTLLARAQQSLPPARHVDLVRAFALAEFGVGEPERGRTLFERLVDRHPKRLDLWWLYIDQETKAGNLPATRSLYERVLVLPQSIKKAKAVLKKWLAFEQRHGTEKDVERVIRRAREFVDATVRKRAASGGASGAVVENGADEEEEGEGEGDEEVGDDLMDEEEDEEEDE